MYVSKKVENENEEEDEEDEEKHHLIKFSLLNIKNLYGISYFLRHKVRYSYFIVVD